jgi:hypothetical protein
VKDGIALELDIFLFSLSQLDLGLFIPTKNEKENFLDQCDELAKQGPPTSQTKENLFWGSF